MKTSASATVRRQAATVNRLRPTSAKQAYVQSRVRGIAAGSGMWYVETQ